MHVSPGKHSFWKCDRKVWQTDGRTDDGQSDPYVSLCFATNTTHRKFMCTNKKSDSPVKLREKMLNFVVKYCENCMFCRAQVIIRGKTSHISWRHSTFLESSRQRRWSSAISWRQNNGKMAERDWSHLIAVLQRLKSRMCPPYPQRVVKAKSRKYQGVFEVKSRVKT